MTFAADARTSRAFERVRLVAREKPWTAPAALGDAIAASWTAATARNPSLFDGTIFVMLDHAVDGGTLTGILAPIAFKTFNHWHEQGRPDWGFRDCFSGAIVRAADGAALVGLAAPGTLSAGLATLIGGLVDRSDVGADGSIDIAAAAARELAEETGLDAADLEQAAGFRVTVLPGLISIATEFRSRDSAETLAPRMRAYAVAATPSELADILVVRGPADLAHGPAHPYLRLLIESLFAA